MDNNTNTQLALLPAEPRQSTNDSLPLHGSAEFKAKEAAILTEVAAKYAWSAQHGGIILRQNPMKQPPLRDYVFNRIMSAHHSFRYRTGKGRTARWFPKVEGLMAALDDPELDCGFLIVERVDFMPGKPEVTRDEDGCVVLNLWKPPPWRDLGPEGAEPTAFLDHLRYLFDGDEEAVGHILNWLAHLIQHPSERIKHALLVTSEAKGIGKSTLGLVVQRLVGERNARVAQTKDLKSQFDGWLVGNLFVQVDEIYESGNWDLANKLKPIITEPVISVNIKHGPQLEVRNYARLLMFSNHTAPLSIEEGDRRYFVVNSEAQRLDDAYYERLYTYIQSEQGMNEIFTFLSRRDLSGFNAHRPPPTTRAKEEIISVSGNPLAAYVAEAVQSGHFFRKLGREFTFDALERQLQQDGYGSHAKNHRELGAALKDANVGKIRRTVEGIKRYFYVLPEEVCVEEADAPF